MNTRSILYYAATLVLTVVSSCEVHLPMPSSEEKDGINVVASSLIIPGQNVALRLAYTEDINDNLSEVYDDRNMLLRALMFPDTTAYSRDTYLMKKYYDELLLRVGEVEVTNQQGEVYPLVFNPETFNFESDHKAVAGERLQFSATLSSRKGKSLNVNSSTVVPGWKPEAKILEATRRYRATEEREDLSLIEMANDSVYELKILINDDSPDLHCYHIRVRGISYNYQGDSGGKIPIGGSLDNPIYDEPLIPLDLVWWTDAFFTNDPLLYDSSITSMFGAWQAYTTDVFTNRQFNNGSYVLTVQARYPYTSVYGGDKRRFMEVQLQPITVDLMNYLSSLYRIRVSDNSDYFSEPKSLSSNINGGVGIFGAMGEPLVLRYWFPGEEDPNYPD